MKLSVPALINYAKLIIQIKIWIRKLSLFDKICSNFLFSTFFSWLYCYFRLQTYVFYYLKNSRCSLVQNKIFEKIQDGGQDSGQDGGQVVKQLLP